MAYFNNCIWYMQVSIYLEQEDTGVKKHGPVQRLSNSW